MATFIPGPVTPKRRQAAMQAALWQARQNRLARVAALSGGGGGGSTDDGVWASTEGFDLFVAVGTATQSTPETFDPAKAAASIALTNSDLTATGTTGSFSTVLATSGKSSGKWYCEFTVVASLGTELVGLANASQSLTSYPGDSENGVGNVHDGRVLIANGQQAGTATWGTGNVVCMAVDLDNGEIWFRVDGGNWNNSGSANPATNTGGDSLAGMNAGPFFPAVCVDATGSSFTANFGATSYAQSVPSGFGNWS